jgi:hypothetical protein
VWKSPQDVADAAVATPDALKWPTKRVPAMQGGKVVYVPKNRVDFVLPDFETRSARSATWSPSSRWSRGSGWPWPAG